MSSGPKKTHYKKLLPADVSDYLGQWDLQKPDGSYAEPVVEIANVRSFHPRHLREGEKNRRVMISFAGKRKKWLAGPVSHEVLKGMFGPYIEDWVGKRIRLYFDPSVTFAKARVGGIRVRPTPPNEEPTSDPLDRPVDERALDRIEEAKSEFAEDEQGAAQ